MRNKLNFEQNEVVSIKLFDDHIEIAKSKSKCLFCSTQDNIKYYNNYSICQSCLDDIIKSLVNKSYSKMHLIVLFIINYIINLLC